jgi:hypothetical protein
LSVVNAALDASVDALLPPSVDALLPSEEELIVPVSAPERGGSSLAAATAATNPMKKLVARTTMSARRLLVRDARGAGVDTGTRSPFSIHPAVSGSAALAAWPA